MGSLKDLSGSDLGGIAIKGALDKAGVAPEQVNQQDNTHITRADQDAFAAASHQRAARAWKDGLFDNEVVPVSIPQRKGDPIVFAQDESIRRRRNRLHP
jgi:acetyl-CoA acetyltransferase